MSDRPDTAELADAPAREAIARDLGVTLFVDAGAGSGKTSALVDRVISLVTTPPESGGVELEHIAAITFTEKAAAELRDRIRRELEKLVQQSGGDAGSGTNTEAASRALDQLDGAAIGTLHAFAQRILTEHPIEAALPPHIEVLDEVESGIGFERRWRQFRDRLVSDSELELTMLLARRCGIGERQLRQLAQIFDDNWDLVASRIRLDPPDPDPQTAISSVLVHGNRIRSIEGPEGDGLTARLEATCAVLDQVRSRFDEGDHDECLRLLMAEKTWLKVGTKGNKQKWGDDELLDQAREAFAAVDAAYREARDAVGQQCLDRLAAALARFTLDSAAERRAEGRLEFHDLLVMARDMLRSEHGPHVRSVLHERYQRILLDEFQDTDPIQIDLAVLITAPPSESGTDWHDLTPLPGRLFVVGDPKQSIYRFRRADISLFLQARQQLVPEPERLSTNFRTAAPLLDWVNHVFGQLIQFEPDSQPEYQPLSARPDRPSCPGPQAPAVRVFGIAPHDGPGADEIRRIEAEDVVAAVATAMHERWQVLDPTTHQWRDPKLSDITILAPTRAIMPFLERALDDLGIAYRAESSSLVYATSEIRDLLLALRAIDDPTDQQALGAVLRSPLFGCGDDDLYRFRAAGGLFDHQRSQPETVPAASPVITALEFMAEMHRRRIWETPSELLLHVIEERRVMEMGFALGRARDLWRRVRFVVDQARAWSEAGGGSLRDYLAWAQLQSDESARVSETILPETDDDAVRIMTVHAAKGLEFPITIVAGLTTQLAGRTSGVDVVWRSEGPVAPIRVRDNSTLNYKEAAELDERMDTDERLRLLYVACTRARDHLVVSLHRRIKDDDTSRTMASSLARVCQDAPHQLELVAAGGVPAGVAPGGPAPMDTPFEEWDRARQTALDAAGTPTTVSATAVAGAATLSVVDGGPDDAEQSDSEVADGLAKEPVDIDLPPWNKGRYGSAIGRAVHGALQTVDLAAGPDGAGVGPAVDAQAVAEAVPQHRDTIEALVRAALGSDTVQRAAARRHWREVFVAAPVGARVLEGYIDLMYQDGDGLVIVDYKTDTVRSPAELDNKVARYRLQAASYAVAVQAVTGQPVHRCVLSFLAAGGARDVDVPDLSRAMDQVGTIVDSLAAPPGRL